jgi:trans-2,3-dihydro-3-hydroxyanthranilate isomerase
MRVKMGTVVLFGNSNIDVRVDQGYEMGRPSTLALRTELSNSEIQVFVGGSVVEVAEGVGLTVSRCQ